MKKQIGILTGGGDVSPLNAVIYSANEEAKKNNYELIGFLKGWDGLLNNRYISLSEIEVSPEIGGTILKSSRVNITKVENGAQKALKTLDRLGLSGLIVIGGEDTLSNSFYLNSFPQVLISKTIDNDVGFINPEKIINFFTLGFPTAAEKISSFVSLSEGLRTTAYSHERIIIVESMGMHAGWLALSSSAGNPDFIIIPEFPVDYDILKEKITEKYLSEKNVIVVIAEGAKWKGGSYISADENEKDSFGHPKFRGAADVFAKKLKEDLKKYIDTSNVNSVNPSYLYRSGKPNQLDTQSAELLGREAVRLIGSGLNNRVFEAIQFNDDSLFVDRIEFDDLNNIEDIHRFVSERFYDPKNYCITPDGINYLSKIVPFSLL